MFLCFFFFPFHPLLDARNLVTREKKLNGEREEGGKQEAEREEKRKGNGLLLVVPYIFGSKEKAGFQGPDPDCLRRIVAKKSRNCKCRTNIHCFFLTEKCMSVY